MLDLTNPDARSALLRVIDGADVVITNLLPAPPREVRARSRVAARAQAEPRRRGAINGYGLGGEEADRPAFDYSAYWARSGMMDLMRDEGVPPSMLRPGVGDHAAASNLVIAILAALRMRDATGQGRYVEVSLLQTGLYILGCDIAMALVAREPIKRHDRKTHRERALEQLRGGGRALDHARDDRSDRVLAAAVRSHRAPGSAGRTRASPSPSRAPRTRAALIAELRAEFAKHTLDEWRPRLDAAGLIWSPVQHARRGARRSAGARDGLLRAARASRAPAASRASAPPFRLEGVAARLAAGLLRRRRRRRSGVARGGARRERDREAEGELSRSSSTGKQRRRRDGRRVEPAIRPSRSRCRDRPHAEGRAHARGRGFATVAGEAAAGRRLPVSARRRSSRRPMRRVHAA